MVILIERALQGIPDFLIGEECNAQKTGERLPGWVFSNFIIDC